MSFSSRLKEKQEKERERQGKEREQGIVRSGESSSQKPVNAFLERRQARQREQDAQMAQAVQADHSMEKTDFFARIVNRQQRTMQSRTQSKGSAGSSRISMKTSRPIHIWILPVAKNCQRWERQRRTGGSWQTWQRNMPRREAREIP